MFHISNFFPFNMVFFVLKYFSYFQIPMALMVYSALYRFGHLVSKTILLIINQVYFSSKKYLNVILRAFENPITQVWGFHPVLSTEELRSTYIREFSDVLIVSDSKFWARNYGIVLAGSHEIKFLLIKLLK